MSIEQFLHSELEKRGMAFETQRNEVVKQYKKQNANVIDNFGSALDDENTALKVVIILGLKRVALKWIDENLPNAFYRPMFE